MLHQYHKKQPHPQALIDFKLTVSIVLDTGVAELIEIVSVSVVSQLGAPRIGINCNIPISWCI